MLTIKCTHCGETFIEYPGEPTEHVCRIGADGLRYIPVYTRDLEPVQPQSGVSPLMFAAFLLVAFMLMYVLILNG